MAIYRSQANAVSKKKDQKNEEFKKLEMEKMAREKAKKENLLHETRFGAKPSTPAKLKCTFEFIFQTRRLFSFHQ